MDSFAGRIEIFADGADIETIKEYSELKWVSGFTTNPTLMKKSGVTDYASFADDVLKIVGNKSISFEVFADTHEEMIRQAKVISKWGKNVFVKIPIVNSSGIPCTNAILELNKSGIPLNITAIMTYGQVEKLIPLLKNNTPIYLSVFAGRIADTGIDPENIVNKIVEQSRPNKAIKIIWASPRELLNIYHAIRSGAHIITITKDILAKSFLIGKNLDLYSIETVNMFLSDSQKSGLSLD